MNESIEVGLTGRRQTTVTQEMSPFHLPYVVLSTPAMIELIEAACFETIQPHLDEGETTVGTHVNVSHDAAAFEGEDVVVACRLTRRDRRRLTFDVEVSGRQGQISAGTHQRAIIHPTKRDQATGRSRQSSEQT